MRNDIVEWLKRSVFAKKLVTDVRSVENNSVLSVRIPSLVLGIFYEDVESITCDIVPPEFDFYYQLIVIVFLQTLFNALLAVLVYKIIVIEQRKKKKRSNESNDGFNGIARNDEQGINMSSSTFAYLFAFGFALPCVVLEPIFVIRTFGIKNVGLIMVFLASPIVNSLRITEAVFGFTPLPARKSLKNYVIYFSCVFGIEFDSLTGDPKRVSFHFFGKRLKTLARDFLIASILISILHPYKYEIFKTTREIDSMEHSTYELFSWAHLFNNYLVALLLSTSLSQSSLGVSTLFNISYGFETYELVLNPMMKSKSPSEFWGRRWNMLVHKGLKNGVYKPTRKHTSSKILGALAAFVVSGIIHEYVNFVMFHGKYHDHNNNEYGNATKYQFRWKQMLFFGWNGILIIFEYSFGHWAIFQWMKQNIPQFLVTALVICSALPLAHLFTSDYIIYGYFDAVYLAEPVVLCSIL